MQAVYVCQQALSRRQIAGKIRRYECEMAENEKPGGLPRRALDTESESCDSNSLL